MQIDQVLPGFNIGDAMSNEARFLQRYLQSRGCQSDIYAESIQPRARQEVSPVAQFFLRAVPDLTLYHYGIGTPITAKLRRRPGRKALIYHNVTPGYFFRGLNEELARLCQLGRTDLLSDRHRYQAVWAVSQYNRQELLRMGYENVRYFPIPINWTEYNQEPDRGVLNTLAALDGPHILFVGRISINKRQDDVVRAFAAFQKMFQPRAHLWLVGNPTGQERFQDTVQQLAQDLGVGASTHFIGHVTFPALLAYYQGSQIFLSMSEHEGLGIPLLEAMYFSLPVLAYAAAAVPETVGSAGLLFQHKRFEEVAALMNQVLNSPSLQETLRAEGRKRVQAFHPDRVLQIFERLLETDFPGLILPESSPFSRSRSAQDVEVAGLPGNPRR